MVDIGRWYTKPIPLFLPKGHFWGEPWLSEDALEMYKTAE